ncbi:MAG: ATP-dependent DNA helicase [Clostridia bacterium]|nr:ATP-dependent DNA helicase [Clostridia bacterium]
MKYDLERAALQISAEELCYRATLCGDLDLRLGKRNSPAFSRSFPDESLQNRVAREAQESGARYVPNVPLFLAVQAFDLHVEAQGCADGVLYGDEVTVIAIRTTSGARFPYLLPAFEEALIKCHAYFLCCESALTHIRTRVSYYRAEDGTCRHYHGAYTREELGQFYLSLLERIRFFATFFATHATVALPSAAAACFPYSTVRPGQEELMKECYRDIRHGSRLFAQAPTGIGKTLSTLYPAVRALGEGHCDKIFYLTAKASTRREAYRAAHQIFLSGAQINTVVLTAREQICANSLARADRAGITHHCNPIDCPYAKGFFDRLPAALEDALSQSHGFPRGSIAEISEKYCVCPYEFELALSEYCDAVICDYNYVFDPQAYLRRYFDGEALASGRYVFLVDEAHNLLDRATDMYSAQLCNESFGGLLAASKEEIPFLGAVEKLVLTMRSFRRLCRDTLQKDEAGVEHGYYLTRQGMVDFHNQVSALRRRMESWLKSNRGNLYEQDVLALSGLCKRFEVISEYYDGHFLTFIELCGERITVRLVCLDPSGILDACLSRAHAAVLFSATLTPTEYFSDVLGGGKNAVRMELPSPFPTERFCPIAVTSVDTRYEARDKSYSKIASLIAATVSAKRGNYIAYFPSYDYMDAVATEFARKYPQVPTVLQTRQMRQGDKEAFLDQFREDHTLRVGFCVLGGSFSEGIDLPGERLIGCIVVGTGIPGISNERNILKEYYDLTRERGYDYAYLFPGMNRVLQAAGRVIRRDEDAGVVVLVDERYASEQYRMLLPSHWSHLQYARNPHELAEIASEFWHNFNKKD